MADIEARAASGHSPASRNGDLAPEAAPGLTQFPDLQSLVFPLEPACAVSGLGVIQTFEPLLRSGRGSGGLLD